MIARLLAGVRQAPARLGRLVSSDAAPGR